MTAAFPFLEVGTAWLILAAVVVACLWYRHRRPLDDIDAWCSRVEQELDAAERRERALRSLDAAGDGADRVWAEREKAA